MIVIKRTIKAAGPFSKIAGPVGFSVGASGISCPTASYCLAIGGLGNMSVYHPASFTEANGVFSAATTITALPAGAGANPEVDLVRVSCVAPGQCVAVGRLLVNATRALRLWRGLHHQGHWPVG